MAITGKCWGRRTWTSCAATSALPARQPLSQRRNPTRFARSGTGTHIDYTADIRLGGLLGLVQPFLGGSFRKIAKDALAGMERTLSEMAAKDAAGPEQAVAPATPVRTPGA